MNNFELCYEVRVKFRLFANECALIQHHLEKGSPFSFCWKSMDHKHGGFFSLYFFRCSFFFLSNALYFYFFTVYKSTHILSRFPLYFVFSLQRFVTLWFSFPAMWYDAMGVVTSGRQQSVVTDNSRRSGKVWLEKRPLDSLITHDFQEKNPKNNKEEETKGTVSEKEDLTMSQGGQQM